MIALAKMRTNWGRFRSLVAQTALVITVVTPAFVSKASGEGWGYQLMRVCIVLFSYVIPILVAADLFLLVTRLPPRAGFSLGVPWSYFAFMTAWWVGALLLIGLQPLFSYFLSYL